MRSRVNSRVSSSEGFNEWVSWEDAVNELNKAAPEEASSMIQTSDLWVRVFTEREVVDSTKWAITIAGIFALLAIVVFTGELHEKLLVFISKKLSQAPVHVISAITAQHLCKHAQSSHQTCSPMSQMFAPTCGCLVIVEL